MIMIESKYRSNISDKKIETKFSVVMMLAHDVIVETTPIVNSNRITLS